MNDTGRNEPCPCGSGKKYKSCHGKAAAAQAPFPATTVPNLPVTPPTPDATPASTAATIENPFKRIFGADGTVNQEYVLSRLQHLEKLVRENEAFYSVRYDRVRLETLLAERQDVFVGAEDDEAFEASFRRFAALALPDLVTKEFDEKAKESFRVALHDSKLKPRDRAAAACGMVLTLPEEGESEQPLHENPLFDLVLRVTFNESMARVEFLQKLSEEKDLSDVEREVRFQEFLRSVPALLFEIQQGFQQHVEKALASYQRGEFSFGIGIDMILHGLRAVQRLTAEYEARPEEERTEEQNRRFSKRFGEELKTAFTEDIGPDEELELMERMAWFLESAREHKEKKAAKGLSAALGVMEHNPEVRERMIFAAYHEAVTGSRIYREEAEEETARTIFEAPHEVDSYVAYGEVLEGEGHATRAERVYRSALGFFPESDVIRKKLAAVAETLEPVRNAEIQAKIRETEAAEREEEEGA